MLADFLHPSLNGFEKYKKSSDLSHLFTHNLASLDCPKSVISGSK